MLQVMVEQIDHIRFTTFLMEDPEKHSQLEQKGTIFKNTKQFTIEKTKPNPSFDGLRVSHQGIGHGRKLSSTSALTHQISEAPFPGPAWMF